MQRPQPEPVTLDDILITEELSRRSPRPPNLHEENQALHTLARQLVNQPETMLQSLVDISLNLWSAGTAGVSLLETTANGEEIFRWNVLAGTLAQYVGGTTPRNFSPCGVCLDRGSPQLYSHPERYFTYFQATNTPFVEGLVLPLIAENHALGTIWIISHDEQWHFDLEDVRVMTSLADFTAAALLLKQRQTRELLAKNAQLEAEVVERKQAQEKLREAQRRLELCLTGADIGVWTYNIATDEFWASDRAKHLHGHQPHEVHTFAEAGTNIHPDDRDRAQAAIAQVIQTYSKLHLEYRVVWQDGSIHWIASDAEFIPSSEQGEGIFYGSVQDISEHKRIEDERQQAEGKLRESEERQSFLLKLSDALRSLADPVDIQETVTRTAMNYFGADRCYYCEIEDGNAIIRRDAARGDLPTVAGVYPLSRFAILQAVVDAGRPFVVQDVHTTDTVDEELRQLCIQLQVISYVNVPVIKNGKPVGVLCLVQSTPRDWTDLEVELAVETADRTWAAVERTRAKANLREAELQRVREQAAREQERQRAETLAELDRAKTLFFTHISHEFRTPLTLLLAPLQDALSDCATAQPSDRVNPLAPPHRERLELAHRNAIRLLKLVNTLLDFSRIEAGRMEAVYEPTDLALFTTELASVFRSAIERAGLRLIVDCPPLPEPVYVDREMWEKIVLNLLSNAFKFTLEGEIAVRLHPADDHYLTLQVQDTGTGIGPEELPHVFERFYQVRRTKARTHEGSGIGLALVHELIRLHGGTVEVSSTVGQGTCFTITIPLGTEHLPNDRLQLDVGDRITATRTLASTAIGAVPYVEEAERWLPAEGGSVEFALRAAPLTALSSELEENSLTQNSKFKTQNSQTARVLLVDDNADMRDYLTRILSEHVQVEAVADGATALAAVQERVPDLVLTDVMMPGLDGFELLKALRANPRTIEIPIILLSARAGEESVIEGLEAGADDYLIKPFAAGQLVSRVKGHLQMAQLRLEALHQERTINRRKEELLSTVSHELNTPLVAILGWTRLLRANPSNQSMLMKSLETIERNATLQAKLVQDLLDISRITAGKLRLSLEPVELESVIENAIASLSHLAQAKAIDIVWWRVTGQPPDTLTQQNVDSVVVMGDRERLQQIIYNLLTNAIKFTPNQGSINVELAVINADNSSDASLAEISITDTGIGIGAEFLPHVFDRFRQAKESSSSKGLGLGLAIARHLVELHGGTIQATSAGIGQGATFIVNLPLLKEF